MEVVVEGDSNGVDECEPASGGFCNSNDSLHHHDHGLHEKSYILNKEPAHSQSDSNSAAQDHSHNSSLSHAYTTEHCHDVQEQNHWEDVCRSYRQYARFAMTQRANHQYRLRALPESQQYLLPPALHRDTPESRHRAQQYQQAAIRNQFCLDCILRHAGQAHSQEHNDAAVAQYSTDSQMSRVSSVLKSLARDWSHEGRSEREMAYRPILDLVLEYVPIQQSAHETNTPTKSTHGPHQDIHANTSSNFSVKSCGPPRICVPGAGVGRLALELAALGYTVQGNEFSLYMLLASDFILNGGIATPHKPLKISPWLLESRNLHQASDQYRIIEIPDIDPYSMLLVNNNKNSNNKVLQSPHHHRHERNLSDEAVVDDDNSDHKNQGDTDTISCCEFSMAAGEFVSIYSNSREHCQWDAVVACFFLDASPSIVEYIQVIHAMLKPGGHLVHLGPLLWHWSGPTMRPEDKTFHDYQTRYSYLDSKYFVSIDLCWEDVLDIIKNVGFDIIHIKTGIQALYTPDCRSMMNTEYQCCSLVARKK